MNNQTLNIGLFGFGCVGKGFYEVLQKTKSFKAEIKKIGIKDPTKKRDFYGIPYTVSREEILTDPDIHVIVELIDDADAAYHLVKEAVKQKKAVITANKKMIATHFEELLALQREHQTQILYEAACCAGIPIIRNLEEYYDNDMLQSINGIINGSTNYILTKTIEDKIPYQQALELAQQAGYAESNPTIDVSGEDAKNKLLILIAHAFGTILQPKDIFTVGIEQLGSLEIQYAIEKGYKIKLIAHAHVTNSGKLCGWVMPQFIPANEKLYHVDDVFNGVATSTYFSDAQFFVGKGAGAYPTASAVISDLSALSYGYKYEYKKIQANPSLPLDDTLYVKILLRYPVLYREYYRQFFRQIEEMYQKEELGYMVGIIRWRELTELYRQASEQLSVVLFEQVDVLPEETKKKEASAVLF